MRLITLFVLVLAACQDKLDLTTSLLWIKVLNDPESCTGHFAREEARIRCENAPEIVMPAKDVRLVFNPQIRDASCTIKGGWWSTQVTLTLPTDLDHVSDKFSRKEFQTTFFRNTRLCEMTVTNGHEVMRSAFGLRIPQTTGAQR